MRVNESTRNRKTPTPRPLVESWAFLLPGLAVAVALLLARAWGLLP